MGLSIEEQRNKIRASGHQFLIPSKPHKRKKKKGKRGRQRRRRIDIMFAFDKQSNEKLKLRKKKKYRPLTDLDKQLFPLLEGIKKLTYAEFLKSEYWKKIRHMVFKRDEFKCTRCPSKKKLQAHHKTYKHHFNEHNHLDDLITLCEECHKKEHNI